MEPPYVWTFKHREISHEHILGTVIRVLFMGLWMLPLIP